MKLMHGVIFAAFTAEFQTVLAATLVMNYDANDPESWGDGVLKDIVGSGQPLVASRTAQTAPRSSRCGHTPQASPRAFLVAFEHDQPHQLSRSLIQVP
jgi:hypothetical protein